MTEFFRFQIDYIYFIYGLSFFVLSGSALLLSKNKKQNLPWISLALFGIVHAVNEWLDLLSLSVGDNYGFRLVRLGILVFSFIFLFDFFWVSLKLRINRWVFIPVLFLVYSGWQWGRADGLNFTARYYLGFLGGFGSAVVLITNAFKLKGVERRYLGFAGLALVFYSFTQLVIVNPPFFNKTLFNQEIFFNTLGFPIQLLRCVLAFNLAFMLLGFWYHSKIHLGGTVGSKRKKYWVLTVTSSCVILIVIGWLITELVHITQYKNYQDDFLTKINTAAGPINSRRIEALTGSLLDLKSPDFIRLKEEVEAFDRTNKDISYVYLLRFKDNKIIFLVDSEQPDSPNYSPPGQVYKEASEELKNNFFKREAFIVGPYVDRWGTWISAFAPIFDTQTNEVVALIGMDENYKFWMQEMFYHRLLGILSSFVLFMFFISIFVIIQINSAAREDIIAQQKNLQVILDSISAWIFYKNKYNCFVRVNRAYSAAMQIAKEDLEGRCLSEIYSKELADAHWNDDLEVISSGKPKLNIIETADTSKGRLWMQTDKYPYKDDEGNIIGVIGFSMDITQLRKYQHELEDKNKELEKLDQLKTDFVSIVSHELRTPLSITKEGISLVLDGIAGSLNPKQDKILTTARNSIDRLARIINSLLDISKIESGRVELKKKVVDLGDLIKNVVSSFDAKAKEKGLELRVDLPKGQNLSLCVDEDRIIQVFTNLISNSIKFTDKGFIDISLINRENEVEIAVSDTGIGIAEENLPKVFGKFLQFGRTAGTGEKGTGLGLSIAKGLIELHRGHIRVESQIDKGSKFIFTLPRYFASQNGRRHIEDAIEEANKTSANFSLVIVTLAYSDKIKSGYLEGTLSALEEIIGAQLNKSRDLVLRYPEEFIIILKDCYKEKALIAQGRIEQALRSYFSSNNLNQDIKLGFSCVAYPGEASKYQELIDRARLV
ncbi:MAG: ATP-binding protein [Candidatus Omnitrophota bacterium]